MARSSDDAITSTLAACRGGDPEAWDRLVPFVYRELRRLAEGYLRRERAGHTLQPTALVHESYLRLVEQRLPAFENRQHFYGLAARIMRQVLVDSARAHRAGKRGSGGERLSLSSAPEAADPGWDILSLDQALGKLSIESHTQAAAIELHYFSGLAVADIATYTGRSERTVARDLRSAKLYLASQLGAPM